MTTTPLGTNNSRPFDGKRLNQDLVKIFTSKEKAISACPDGNNMCHWKATIEGPNGTIYDGQSYRLSFDFPPEYPFKPPVVKFITPCFHPNVDHHGNICLDILREQWSPSYDVLSILVSIRSLLGDPNIDSPLNLHAADLWPNQELFKKVLLEKYAAVSKASQFPT